MSTTRKSVDTHDLPPCDVLRQMVAEVLIPRRSGEQMPLSSGIGAVHAAVLYKMVLRERPETVLEIGMGHGMSTLSILCALNQTGGRLISIDPYVDWRSGKDAALYAVERAGYSGHHTFIEKPSCLALPELFGQGQRIDFGYIDGNHSYEHAFIDAFYMDRMLRTGGVLGFNDTGWRSVFRVIRFLEREWRYEELDAGLAPNYAARNVAVSLIRRLLRMPRQDRYFRKRGDHE